MGKETWKCYEHRLNNGFFEKYLNGDGIDIGGGDDCLVVPNGTVRLFDKSDGDAQYLNTILSNTFDFVYSSHCLEHMVDPYIAYENWIRVCKHGKYIYIIVPHEIYYEKLIWPSRWNPDHKHSFTLGEKKLPNSINVYQFMEKFLDKIEIIDVFLNLQNYDHSKPINIDQTANHLDKICCHIEMIAKKR